MIKFISNGSTFNMELGNNCGFIKKDNILILFDCGLTVFRDILKLNLLDGIDKIYILITHLHSDHISSVSDIIGYGYFHVGTEFSKCVTILGPESLKIQNYLKILGTPDTAYDYINLDILKENKIEEIEMKIQPIHVNHYKDADSFGYLIEFNNKIIYYSGDCSDIPKDILGKLYSNKIDYFYQDTCILDYENNSHVSLRKLSELIDEPFRNKVYCMHLDSGFDTNKALALGFKISQLYEKKL